MDAYTGNSAYYQTFTYDEFDNLTGRSNGSWRYHDTTLMQYANNRNTSTTIYPNGVPPQTSNWVHDADGNVTNDHNKQYSYDAAGHKRVVTENSSSGSLTISQNYDADGDRVKRIEQNQATVTSYYLRSSVLGKKVITELNQLGQKRETSVYANGTTLAQQKDNQVRWTHVDPVTSSLRETSTNGNAVERLEFDPLGNDAPLIDPAPPDDPTPDYEYRGSYDNNGNPYDGPSGCMIDGQQVPCSMMMQVLRFGSGVIPQ